MSNNIILAPSSLFPVDEIENSDCEHCEKFNKQLQVELRYKTSPDEAVTTPCTSASTDATMAPAVTSSASPRKSFVELLSAGCVPDLVIDCTCLDHEPKPTRLYFCCCLNVRCSLSACRSLLFILAFGILGGGVAAAAGVAIWGIAVDWTEARNYGLLGFAVGLLALIYVCCVASHCQASRKTKELREQALAAQLQQQQLQQSAASQDRRATSNRLSSSANFLGSSQLSLQHPPDEALQLQQKPPLANKKKKAATVGGGKTKKVTAKKPSSVANSAEERVLLPSPDSVAISLGKF